MLYAQNPTKDNNNGTFDFSSLKENVLNWQILYSFGSYPRQGQFDPYQLSRLFLNAGQLF